VLRQLLAQGDGSPQARARLADEVARMTADYVHRQLNNRRDFLMAEQAFRQEALLPAPGRTGARPRADPAARRAADAQVVGSRQPQDARC
jgi:DNA-binding transcriptional regulator YbjK